MVLEPQCDPPIVVYIAGYGRSGSTLLAILLGNIEQVFNAGEIASIFDEVEWEKTLCACGEQCVDCPFWKQVWNAYGAYLGSDSSVRLDCSLQQSIEKRQALWRLLFGLRSSRGCKEYARHQQALFRAISAISGKCLILDASKSNRLSAGRLYALWQVAGCKVRVIHLVRDGRGVMWSMIKGSNRKIERGETNIHLPFATLRALYGWTLANLVVLVQSWFLPTGSVLRVHYEALVCHPERELSRIARFLQVDVATVIDRLRAGQMFSAGHSFGGNRLRHIGVGQIREDKEWQEKLSKGARLLFWVFGWPAHLLFGRSAALLETAPP